MDITPHGITTSFDFHHVRRIVVGPLNRFSNFVSRRVHLIDAQGIEVDVTCFSEDGAADMPVRVEEDGEQEEEPENLARLPSELTDLLRALPNILRPVKVALTAAALLLGVTAAEAQTTCTRIGNYTYCNDNSGGSVTCTRIGNYTYCN